MRVGKGGQQETRVKGAMRISLSHVALLAPLAPFKLPSLLPCPFSHCPPCLIVTTTARWVCNRWDKGGKRDKGTRVNWQ